MSAVQDGTVKAYIAFPSEVVKAWPSLSMPIEPSWFQGGRSRGRFVPLKAKAESAIKVALEVPDNSCQAAKAATEVTSWHVMELSLNPLQLMEAWNKELISRDMNGRIEWWGPLQQDSVGTLEWCTIELEPIGLVSWSHMVCERKYKRPSAEGACAGCAASAVPLWAATSWFARQAYCAGCWNDFVKIVKAEAENVGMEY